MAGTPQQHALTLIRGGHVYAPSDLGVCDLLIGTCTRLGLFVVTFMMLRFLLFRFFTHIAKAEEMLWVSYNRQSRTMILESRSRKLTPVAKQSYLYVNGQESRLLIADNKVVSLSARLRLAFFCFYFLFF